jgi:hypothetical protein
MTPAPQLAFLLRRIPGNERQFHRGGCRHRAADGGQATVELAVALPFVLVLALTLMQAALVLRDDLAVANAAREAVRAASLDSDPARAERAAVAVLPGARVRSGPRPPVGELVQVRVTYRSITDLPLVGPLLPDPLLEGRAAMRVER